MKVSETAKMVPNFLRDQTEEIGEFGHQTKLGKEVFSRIDNLPQQKTNRKKQRKNKTIKSFIEMEDQKSRKMDQNVACKENMRSNVCYTKQEGSASNELAGSIMISAKSKILLDLHFDEQSDEQVPQSTTETVFSKKKSNQEDKSQVSLPLNRLHLLDWSSSSDNGEGELKIVEMLPQEVKQQPKIEKKPILLQNLYQTQNSLFEQVAQGTTVRCLIRRDKKNALKDLQYNVYLQHSLKHILTVRKEGIWKYSFYQRQNKPGPAFVYQKFASMSETLFGNNFTLLKNGSKNSQITISYQTNILGLKGPRKLNIYVPKKQIPREYLHECYQDNKWKNDILKCVSKSAKWNQQINSYVLSFKGRALQSSIKNFVITDEDESEENYFIIFGKAGPDLYNLDISYPFSLIQGISVAMTSFQRKMSCD